MIDREKTIRVTRYCVALLIALSIATPLEAHAWLDFRRSPERPLIATVVPVVLAVFLAACVSLVTFVPRWLPRAFAWVGGGTAAAGLYWVTLDTLIYAYPSDDVRETRLAWDDTLGGSSGGFSGTILVGLFLAIPMLSFTFAVVGPVLGLLHTPKNASKWKAVMITGACCLGWCVFVWFTFIGGLAHPRLWHAVLVALPLGMTAALAVAWGLVQLRREHIAIASVIEREFTAS